MCFPIFFWVLFKCPFTWCRSGADPPPFSLSHERFAFFFGVFFIDDFWKFIKKIRRSTGGPGVDAIGILMLFSCTLWFFEPSRTTFRIFSHICVWAFLYIFSHMRICAHTCTHRGEVVLRVGEGFNYYCFIYYFYYYYIFFYYAYYIYIYVYALLHMRLPSHPSDRSFLIRRTIRNERN